MNFIFVVLGPKIGLGHLNRCRSLAYALKKKERLFMVGPSKMYINNQDLKIFKKWILRIGGKVIKFFEFN